MSEFTNVIIIATLGTIYFYKNKIYDFLSIKYNKWMIL